MSLQKLLVKRAQELLEKGAFQPMPNGQPPADPVMMGGGGAPMDPAMMGGGAPMDPAMMGGGGAPMDPAMMGGGMPMDPSMMGLPPGMAMAGPAPATIGQLSITDFQNMLADTLTLILQQTMGQAAGGAPAEVAVPAEAGPMEDARGISNTELSEKVDAILALLTGGGMAPPPEMAAGAPPPGMDMVAPGPEMGFGGQPMAMPAAPAPGMEIQASVKKAGLADLIIQRTAKARKG